VTKLLDALEQARAEGRKLLVPYLMAGIPDAVTYPDALRAIERHADAIEVGIPYSDPLMDGPVIAAAGERAIAAGVGPVRALELTSKVEATRPRALMTYYNPIHHMGEKEFCRTAASDGFAGLIVPDLPLEESDDLRGAASDAGLAWIPLVAPTSSPERIARIAATATGFVYAVSTLGVTGTRQRLSERAAQVAKRCKQATELPVLVGIGVSDADQAREAVTEADGVVIGSAVVRMVLEQGAAAAERFLQGIRTALDS
jgi:tryptophan synthase alpha chain